jgi:hypothetical protein
VVFFVVAEIAVVVRLATQIIDVETRKKEKKLAQVNFLPSIGKLDAELGDLADSLQGGTFNDGASLRGTQHRMLALRITIASRDINMHGDEESVDLRKAVHKGNIQTRIAGIVCDYEMDGIIVRTPLHETAYRHSPKWDIKKQRMFLMQGEFICLFALYFPAGSTRYSGAVAIRVWTESNGVLNPTPREFGQRPAVGMYEVYVPDVVSLGSGQIVAFHGTMGEGLQMLGAVVQHSTEQHSTEHARSKELVAALAGVCAKEKEEASEGRKALKWGSASTVDIVNETTAIVRAEEQQHWQLKWAQDALGKADEEMAVGTRIHFASKGWGTYKGFKKKPIGANDHTIEFDEPPPDTDGGERKLTLSLKSEEWSVTKVEAQE